MTQLLDTAINFLEENNWAFSPTEDGTALQTAFRGYNGEWACYALADEERHRFVFYSVCPVCVPLEKCMSMAEFITRLNYGLTLGNFDLDFDDGEIRFKTSIDVEGDRLTKALVQQLILSNVTIMDSSLPSIMKVVYGNVTPTEAIAEIINNDDE